MFGLFETENPADLALVATGLGVYYAAARSFHDQTVGLAPQTKAPEATAATVAGVGLAILGVYRLDPSWGKTLGVVVTGLVGYNLYRHKTGEPTISLSPIAVPARLFP